MMHGRKNIKLLVRKCDRKV